MAVNINVPSQVKTYANLAAFPASGALKTIYIAEDTNKTYRWTGSVYTEISATAASTWGAIGGTLSNQTDLQNALNAKQNSLGYTPVPETRTLTINGTTQDLSADRTFTISTGITIGTTAITSGTVGRVLFEGTGNVVQESANLFWDNTNGRLGIGGSPAVYNLDVKGIGIYRGGLLDLQNTTGNFTLSFYPSAGNIGIINSDILRLGRISNSTVFLQGFASGNVGINTTTDAGFRLDVNGTARVVGQATIQGMTVGLGAGANANSVAVGLASLASNSTGSANTAVGASALTSNVSGASNTGIGFAALSLLNSGSTNTSIGSASLRNVTTANNSTAIGNEAGRYIANGSTLVTTVTDSVFLGSSTKPLADSQSNQIVIGHNAIGAGSNTVTLGNTSITKTILRGTVNAANLPTSSAGLSAGDIWNDAGTLKIV